MKTNIRFYFLITFLIGGSLFFASPVLAQSIVEISYQDDNSNGLIEKLQVTLSSPVDRCDFEVKDWIISDPGSINITSIDGIIGDCDGSSSSFYLLVSGTLMDVTGGNIVPRISYKDQGQLGSISTVVGDLLEQNYLSVIDRAPPHLIDGWYRDNDHNGTIDTLELQYSQESQVNFSFNSFDWTLNDSSEMGLRGPLSSGYSSGNKIILQINKANSDVTGSQIRPILSYLGTSITDSFGNQTPEINNFGLQDGAAPAVLRSLYLDNNHDGRVETVKLEMSKDVGLDCIFDYQDWEIINAGGIALKSVDGCQAIGQDIYLNVTSDNLVTGSDIEPVLRYLGDSSGGKIKDGQGNITVFSDQTLIDDASPVITQVNPVDGSQVSLTQAIEIIFSEPMNTNTLQFSSTPTIPYSFSWGLGNTKLVITHSTGWPDNSLLEFTLSAEANQGISKDLQGKTSWSYLTSINQEILADSPDSSNSGNSGNALQEVAGNQIIYEWIDPLERDLIWEYFGLQADPLCEESYRPLVESDYQEFGLTPTPQQLDDAVFFVCYGHALETINLGVGERRAQIRDYLDTTGYAEIWWDDIFNNARGIKLSHRNLPKESEQLPRVLYIFERIFGRRPDFTQQIDDLAWNTLLYRIRFPRDLDQEASALIEYKRIFGDYPQTPLDWATLRVLAYVIN